MIRKNIEQKYCSNCGYGLSVKFPKPCPTCGLDEVGEKMRNPDRIEPMLELLKEIWIRSPDLRLSQLIYVAAHEFAHPYEGVDFRDIFNVEDDDLMTGLIKYFRRPGGCPQTNTPQSRQ